MRWPAGTGEEGEKMETIKPGTDTAVEQYTQAYGDEGCDWGTRDALQHAIENGWEVCKYTDPTEEAREGLSVNEALDVCAEDAGLIWLRRSGLSEAQLDDIAVYLNDSIREAVHADHAGEAPEAFARAYRARDPKGWREACALAGVDPDALEDARGEFSLDFGNGPGGDDWDAESYWGVTVGNMWGPRSALAQFDLQDASAEQIDAFLCECEIEAVKQAGGQDGDQPREWASLRSDAVAAMLAEQEG